ncbi:zinc finger, CCHC-type containing protein, partial [Tanacetum coccineum]
MRMLRGGLTQEQQFMCVKIDDDLKFSSEKIVSLFNVLHVPNMRKNLVFRSVLNNYGYKQAYIVNDNIASAFMSTSKLNDSILWHTRLGHVHFKRVQDMSKDGFSYVYLLHTKDEALDKFKVFKTEVELQQGSLIKRFRTDRGGEYINTLYFQSVGIIQEMTTSYTPQQNDISERKNRVLKEMVNYMFNYSGLSQGFWGEAMAVVRLPDPKLKTLGEKGIKCIFVGYVEHSNAFRFYVIEPNDSVSINSIIESIDAIFDEKRFSSVPRPGQRSLVNGTEDIGCSVVPEEVTKEDDPKIFDEAMKSQNVAFWKEAIKDEMDSIMGNNTWVLADLPPGCKPLGCKWIFKRKLKVDGTIEKFKARLVIQGFKQKPGIDYFDTYASLYVSVTCIELLMLWHQFTEKYDLIFHQMDVKTTFLNGDLDEEVYMNQPQGFIMPGNENKVCKLIKSLYGLKQAPKQWHQKFDEVVLSNGYLLNQADKCVDLTKEFLSSKFSMKDMGEADVILGIRIKHESNGIAISQSHYIEIRTEEIQLTLRCTPVSTLWKQERSRSLKCLKAVSISQLEYFKIDNTEDNSSTSGWVSMLNRGAISWASKKQTYITSSTMEYEFVALAAAGKEAEWLRNLILEIPLWSKPIAPISIRCDSAATLTKAYSQMHLVLKSAEGMSFKSNLGVEFKWVQFEKEENNDDLKRKQVDGLEVITGAINHLNKEFRSGTLSLDLLGNSFMYMKNWVPDEYKLYGLSTIACSFALPLLSRLFEGWDPLKKPAHHTEIMSVWKDLLGQTGSNPPNWVITPAGQKGGYKTVI